MISQEIWQLFLNPVRWGDTLVYALSYFDLYSEIYDACKISILMNTLSALIAAEGISELTARLGGAAFSFFPK